MTSFSVGTYPFSLILMKICLNFFTYRMGFTLSKGKDSIAISGLSANILADFNINSPNLLLFIEANMFFLHEKSLFHNSSASIFIIFLLVNNILPRHSKVKNYFQKAYIFRGPRPRPSPKFFAFVKTEFWKMTSGISL